MQMANEGNRAATQHLQIIGGSGSNRMDKRIFLGPSFFFFIAHVQLLISDCLRTFRYLCSDEEVQEVHEGVGFCAALQ